MKTPSRFWWLGSMIAIATVLSAGCNIFDDDDDGGVATGSTTIFGSGVAAEESRSVGGFAGLRFFSEGSVRIERTGSESCLVRADDNVLPHLISVVGGGTLDIRTQAGYQLEPVQPIEFEITAATLETVELIGVGSVSAIGVMTDRPRLTLSGVGTLDASSLDGNELDARLSGTGDLIVSGNVNRQRVILSGTGDYEGRDLTSTEAEVTLSGQGDVTVSASDQLTVTISGLGNVFYVGTPAVTSVITGSGRVEQISK